MRKIFAVVVTTISFLFLLVLSQTALAQTNFFPTTGSVGVGTAIPNTSSALEIKSTTQGILVPRMTMDQRNAIRSPTTGLLMYQTDNIPGFYYFDGAYWKALIANSYGDVIYGARGGSFYGFGVSGQSGGPTSHGVYGYSFDGMGILGQSSYNDGILGISEYSIGVVGYTYDPWETYAGYFGGNVYSTGYYETSDRNLKQNIRNFSNATDIINQLYPSEYEYRQDGDYKLMNLPQGSHYGLIAQDVEKILPGVVKEAKFDPGMIPKPGEKKQETITEKSGKATISFKTINYTELIPLIIKAIQEANAERDAKIEGLQKQIDVLQEMVKGNVSSNQSYKQDEITPQPQVSKDAQSQKETQSQQNVEPQKYDEVKKQTEIVPASNTVGKLDQIFIDQYNATATVGYYLPSVNGNARIDFYNEAGSVIKSVKLDGSGYDKTGIKINDMPFGNYKCVLVVDDKTVDSKPMTIGK